MNHPETDIQAVYSVCLLKRGRQIEPLFLLKTRLSLAKNKQIKTKIKRDHRLVFLCLIPLSDLINSAWYFLLFLANQRKLFSGSGGGVSAVSLLSLFLFSLILVLVYAFIVYFITNDPFLKNIMLIFFFMGAQSGQNKSG